MGKIAVHIKEVPNTTPILFLHGIFFDHHLWNYQVSRIKDRTTLTIDMPLHRDSKQPIPDNWDLEDFGDMLIDILDTLQLSKVIAIGHSWGSMTILRADDASGKVQSLGVPFFALKGKEDYVPVAKGIHYTIVDGGHISPLEVPEEVLMFVRKVIDR
jgi:hypothetical protein